MSTPAKPLPRRNKQAPVRETSSVARKTVASALPRPSSNGARGAASSQAREQIPPLRPLNEPELFINRELSLLDFQRRVLEEAQDATNPLLERLMFLSFVGSNEIGRASCRG